MSKLISKYKIITKYNLVIEYHSGTIDVDSYIKFKIKISNDPLFSSTLNSFVNFEDVVFEYSAEDVTKFFVFIENNSKFEGKRQVSILTKTPNQVVPPILFKLKQKQRNSLQSLDIFSTRESALKWLKTPSLTIKELITIINNLKK